MSDMEEQRGSLGAASLKNLVYAVGGGKPGIQSDTMEILDPNRNLWMKGKTMNSKRCPSASNASILALLLFSQGPTTVCCCLCSVLIVICWVAVYVMSPLGIDRPLGKLMSLDKPVQNAKFGGRCKLSCETASGSTNVN